MKGLLAPLFLTTIVWQGEKRLFTIGFYSPEILKLGR